MRNIHIYVVLLLAMFLLIGCKSSVSDIKEAVSGIHTQAEKAKSGLTIDAYTLREYEIEYKDELFTVDELFKTILRDVQWEYEKNHNKHILLVKGTWKEPLFEQLQLTDDVKEKLSKSGKIFIELVFIDGLLNSNETTVSMKLNEELLVDEKGAENLYYLYDIYLQQKM